MNVKALMARARTHGHAMTIVGGTIDRRDLVDKLIADVGHGAIVDIVSWTIGLADCQWLEQQVVSGRVGRLRLIADVSTRAKTPERYEPLARIGQVIDVGDVHAKASIVRSADGQRGWVEVTSANLNRNRRYESHALTTDPEVVASMLADFDAIRTGVFEPASEAPAGDDDLSQILAMLDGGDDAQDLLRRLGE